MAQNIIELGFNVDELTEQKKQVLAAFQEVFDKGASMNAILGKNIPVDGIASYNDMMKQTKVQLDAMTGATNNLSKAQIENARVLKAQAQAEQAQQKAQQETLKTSQQKEKALKVESKAAADASNDYKQLSLAYNEAALRAKNLQIVAPNSDAAKQATKEAAELGAYLKKLDESVGQHQRNVGNYSSALTGYANVLRGLRGPTKLLGEALGIGAMEADQLRLVIEHSLQGLAAWFRGKEKATAATQANTKADAENVVVQEEQVVVNEAVTTSLVEESAAADTATASTTGLMAAVAAITAPLVIIVGLVAIVGKLWYDYAHQAESAAEANKELYDSKLKIVEGIDEAIDAENNRIKINRRSIEDELANAEASGQSQEKIFAIKKKLADFDLKNSITQRISHDATNEGYNRELKLLDVAQEKLDRYNKRLEVAKQHKLDMSQKNFFLRWTDYSNRDTEESLKPFIEEQEARVKLHKKQAAQMKALLEKDADSLREYNKTQLEETKFTEDEKRKIRLESAKFESDLIKAKNAIILGDERSSEAEKLIAMQSNFDEEKKILIAERDFILNNISSTNAEKRLAEIKYKEESDKLKLQKEEQDRKLILEYTNRNKAAILSAEKSNLDLQIKQEEAVTKNVEKELEDRLTAYAKAIEDKAALLKKDYDNDITKAGLTVDELAAIDTNYRNKKAELTANSEKEVYEITKSYLDKKAKDIEEANKGTSNAGNTDKYQIESEQLNNALRNNLISYSTYLNKKKQLDEQYAIDSDKAAVNDDEKKLRDLEALAQQEAALEIGATGSKLDAIKDEERKTNAEILNQKQKLASDKKKLSDAEIAAEIEARQKLANLEKQLATQVFNFVKTAVDAGYENRVNAIEKQIAITDQMYQNEEAAVQKSNLNATDKLALEIQLQSQKQAADREAAQEEKKLKREQAKIDRDIKLVEIAAATALAEVNALSYLSNTITAPLYPAIAATIAAVGAAQTAALLATPIPSYAEGTDYHAGGLARYGEAGAELIKEPNKAPWIAYTETISYLPKGTQVIPMSAAIKDNDPTKGLGWEQVKYLGAVIKKANKPVNNIINTPPPVLNIDFDVYYNQKLKGYN